MIPRNEETNSEILLQFFPVTWAKYFYDELVCQSLGSTLLVFVSNFPSFMSIGRKQHNGYQLLTFLLLTVPHPSPPPPPAGRDQDVNLSPLAWPSLGWQVK